jgi:hypothetical protein
VVAGTGSAPVSLPPSLAYEGEPEATIERCPHWGYRIEVTWGLMGLYNDIGWWRPTRKSAERKARKLLAWWKAQEAPRETWTVDP